MRQPIKDSWLTPKGRKLCEPYQNLAGGQKARQQLSLPPTIGGRWESGSRPSLGKEGWVVVKKYF